MLSKKESMLDHLIYYSQMTFFKKKNFRFAHEYIDKFISNSSSDFSTRKDSHAKGKTTGENQMLDENSSKTVYADRDKKAKLQRWMSILNVIGLILAVIAIFWGFKSGLFTNEEQMKSVLMKAGPAAPLVFILIQIVQTVIPIIPGALTIPMGTMIFGPWYGFALNFIGVMIGSVMNFALARHYGRPLVEILVADKDYDKYIGWLDSERGFDKLFTFGMFFPLSPADLLCYFAGLSTISFKKYLIILSLGKPFTLFIYQYGMTAILEFIFSSLGF